MSSIVTFGETMLRLSTSRGKRLESADCFAVRTAGAESNVAIAAARLGADVAWVSKLPDSPLGRRVVADVRKHGVETSVSWTNEGRQGVYYLEPAGAPRGTNVIYDRANAAITAATPDELDVRTIENADVFFTTGITPALSETLYETTRRLLARASEAGATIGFDLNYRSKLWSKSAAREGYEDLLPAIDVLFAPERDVRSILGVEGEPAIVTERLESRYGCGTIVLTRGEEGVIARSEGETFEQPAFEADTVDPIGTGDAFVGGFFSQFVRGKSIPDALRYGAATAALKRTIEGDLAVVSESEVERVIEDSSGRISR